MTDYCGFYEERDEDPPKTLDIHGWTATLSEEHGEWTSKHFGKHQDIFAFVLKKEDAEVYVVNSSEYAGVGEYRISAFANDEATLIEFLADVGHTGAFEHIDSPGIAEQWL
jgi:hypothetical protein